MLFIILFLHQTTTLAVPRSAHDSCLSSCSYIKPQQQPSAQIERCVVYHLVPTSNHNVVLVLQCQMIVVYHLVPTSNHNTELNHSLNNTLFIILFLHQTTTALKDRAVKDLLFIILFLHQTTTDVSVTIIRLSLFIILFLHQTTTLRRGGLCVAGCLSSCSYIKPQPIAINLLVISKILRFELIRNGRAGRFLLQIY